MNPLRLANIRTRAEAFLTESRKEWYEVGAGLKEDVRLSEIFAKYADLFTRGTSILSAPSPIRRKVKPNPRGSPSCAVF